MMPTNDYSWLRDQLTTIARDVSDVKADVAAIKANSSQYEKSVADLEQTVYGNGKEGLKATIQKQASEITTIRTAIKSDRRWIGKIACVLGWFFTALCLAWQTFAK